MPSAGQSFSAVVNPADMAAMNEAILFTKRWTHRSGDASAEYGAVLFSRSGKSMAKMSKKRHKIVRNPAFVKGDVHTPNNFGWALEKLQQSGVTAYKPVPGTGRHAGNYMLPGAGPGAKPSYKGLETDLGIDTSIRRRGLAKSSWGWMLRKLGKSNQVKTSSMSYSALYKARQHVHVEKKQAYRKLTNYIMYMEKAFPTIVPVSLRKAAEGMIYNVKRSMAKELRKKWF